MDREPDQFLDQTPPPAVREALRAGWPASDRRWAGGRTLAERTASGLTVFGDAVLRRLPFPWSSRFVTGRIGGVTSLRMARLYFGQELMAVHCFAVGDTLVDTGLACHGAQLVEFARRAGIRRAIVTHHHEDHAGGAAALVAADLTVLGSAACVHLLVHDLPVRFYQHLAWGRMGPAPLGELGETVPLGRYQARVVAAPGHSHDQVVFHVPEEGWLFAGDAFLHERVKLFRRDEDFAATLQTLEHLVTLDFDALYCAHRPREKGGKAALQQKLSWLRELDQQIPELLTRPPLVGLQSGSPAVFGVAMC